MDSCELKVEKLTRSLLKTGVVILQVLVSSFCLYDIGYSQLPTPNSQLSSDMILIPKGKFIIGSNASDGKIGFEVSVDSIPKRTINLKAFYMDRFEVSIGQYRSFVGEVNREAPAIWKDYGLFGYPKPEDDHPVVDVTFYDAEAYCHWVGKRLPTEEEWEKAARGTDGRVFPWGNELNPEWVTTEDRGRSFTTPVGAMKQDVSPYGVYDMGGNAMEWTATPYRPYPGGIRKFKEDTRFRILRGGTWSMPAQPFARTAHRHHRLADLGQPDFGFRCAKDA